MTRRLLWCALAGLSALLAAAALLVAVLYGWQRDWLRGELEARLAAALQQPVAIGSLEGPLHREITARALRIGDASDPLLEISELRVRFGALRLAGSPSLTISALELRQPRLRVRRGSDGRWPWDGAPSEADETDASPRLALIVERSILDGGVLEVARDAGAVARLELDGTLDDLRAGAEFAFAALELSFAVQGLADAAEGAIRGALRASYQGGRWSLVELRAAGLGAEVEARGDGSAEVIERAVLTARIASLDALDAQLLGDALGLSGSLAISADLSGPLRRPTGSLALAAEGLRSGDLDLGALQVEVASEPEGRLRVDALRFELGAFELRAEPGAALVVDANGASLRDLELRDRSRASALRLDLDLPPLPFSGLDALLGDAATRASVDAKAWPLGTFAPLWRAAGIEAAGSLDADLTLTGAAGGPQLRGTARIESASIRAAGATASGMQARVNLEGPLRAPRARVEASAAAAHWEDWPIGAVRVAFEAKEDRTFEIEELAASGGALSLRVADGARLRAQRGGVALEDVELFLEEQRFAVSGWIAPGAAEQLRIAFPGLDAKRLVETANALRGAEVGLAVAGAIAGDLVWDGPLGNPTLSGKLLWSNAQLGELAFERVEARVATERGLVAVTSRWAGEGAVALDLEAALPADRVLANPAGCFEDPRASLRLSADRFELAALSVFLPPEISSLTGRLSADLRARGGPQPLAFSGRLAVDDGAAAFRALGRDRPWPFSVRASLRGERIDIEQLRIGEEAAVVTGTGALQFASGRAPAFDLELGFDRFAIDLPRLVVGTLDGPVRLGGTLDAPELRGALELSDLRVQIPEPDAPEFKEIRVLAADGADADAEFDEDARSMPLFERLRLDLAVALRRNSWARGRGANVELEGDLEAKKDPGLPLSLSGQIETVRGTYEIYGRRFRIERGAATLDGAAEVDPLLDVRAVHRVRNVKIIARLDGRLSEPRLRFESEPELSETDIASYLFLGRPAADAGSGQQGALDAAAARIAAGATLSELERIFGGSLPVDLIDVRMEGSDENSELRAGVGKYVGERLFLYYERGFADEGENELRAEYELTPNWSVESNVSSGDEVGADLVFEAEN